MPRVDKLRHYFNHPGFVRPMIDGVLRSLADLPDDVRDGAHIAFTTHSIPTAAADVSGPVDDHGDGGAYVKEHLDVARVIADAVREETGVDHPGSSSTSRGPAPRTSRGWSPTSATTSRSGTAPVCRPS